MGATSTSRAARGTMPSARTPAPASTNGRAGLHDAERAVLTAVPAGVLPVVRGGVHHAEVGRRGVVEELGHLLERVGVGVLRPGRVGVGELGVEPGQTSRGLVGEGVVALAPPRP